MKITGNENGQKLDNSLVTQATIDSISNSNSLSDNLFFNSLEATVDIVEADYDKGAFNIKVDLNKVNEVPSIEVSIDSLDLVEDLFKNSADSANNRAGVLQFIREGILSAVTNSFSVTAFNDHLQILDEKLKSKTLEIQQSNVESGTLEKREEVPNLVTSADDLQVSKTDILEEEKRLLAQGFEEHHLDEDDDEVPANYKPLSDGTDDGEIITKSKEPEDDGVMESIGKVAH